MEYELTGLDPGTEYMMSVRASFVGVDAENSFYVAQSVTFGNG